MTKEIATLSVYERITLIHLNRLTERLTLSFFFFEKQLCITVRRKYGWIKNTKVLVNKAKLGESKLQSYHNMEIQLIN